MESNFRGNGMRNSRPKSALYSPLDRFRRQIRVLILHPGQWHEEIRCSLRIKSLNNQPEYEAVSYAWGDHRNKRRIRVNGCTVRVTSNLEICLRHLRRQNAVLCLWIDALCIHQGDPLEKTHQVGMMGDIYKMSMRTYVWLGTPPRDEGGVPTVQVEDESSDIANPFYLAHHFAADKHMHELPCCTYSKIRDRVMISDIEVLRRIWTGLCRATAQRWWFRFWCVQELILSRSVMVVFGRWRIDWKIIERALLNWYEHSSTCCITLDTRDVSSYTFSGAVLASQFLRQQSPPSSSKLDWMLRIYRNRDCQDPRDKIYGVLGLVEPSVARQIVTDYSASVRDVYLSAMEAVIRDSQGDLQYLTGTGFNSRQFGLPSWIRNFAACPSTQSMVVEDFRFSTYHLYGAWINRDGSKAVVDDRGFLRVRGVAVDTIDRVGVVMYHTDNADVVHIMKKWQKLAGVSKSSKVRKEKFGRVISGDLDVIEGDPRRAERSEVSVLRNLWNMVCRTSQVRELNMRNAYQRAFFVSKKGVWGLCDEMAEPGDEVWVLEGGKVPFVLRQEQREETMDRVKDKRFKRRLLVGECYLEGIMDGEVLKSGEALIESIALV